MFELDVDGNDGWVPLRVDLDHESLVSDLKVRIPDQDPMAWELLANLAARNVSAAQEIGPPLLAIWARITEPDQVVPDALATLSMVPTDESPTAESVAGAMLGDAELFRPVAYVPLETASGPATGLEALTLSPGEEGDTFVGLFAVIWVRADEQEALVLSASTLDLVAGAAWREELFQLAQGVRGY